MNVVLGQYLPGCSILHKLDPRIKLISSFLLMIVVFSANSYLSLIAVSLFTFLLILFSSISPKIYIKNTKFVIYMTIFSVFLNLFYGQGEVLLSIAGLKITDDGLKNAMIIAGRIINMILISACLMFTTSPNDMTHGLQSLLKPLKRLRVNVDDLIIMITIALRFIPITLEEATKIFNAQRSRGADMGKGGISKKIRSFIPVILPLFVATFRRAYELSTAMECRCYGVNNYRTQFKKFKIKSADILSLIVVIALMLGVIFCNKINIMKWG